jgi:membrane dipeptidase
MDDEQLLAVKKNGGVVQIVGYASFLKTDSKERIDALAKLREDFKLSSPNATGQGGAGANAGAQAPVRPCPIEGSAGAAGQARMGGAAGPGRGAAGLNALSPEQRADYDKRLAEINAKYPPAPRANVKDLVNHIDYAVKLIGIDHVGIASDFDGGGGIDGWNSAAEAFNVTLELVRRGYTEEQISKLWSGNLLRVWGEVQKTAQEIQKAQK